MCAAAPRCDSLIFLKACLLFIFKYIFVSLPLSCFSIHFCALGVADPFVLFCFALFCFVVCVFPSGARQKCSVSEAIS
jgi:hypothetical protein